MASLLVFPSAAQAVDETETKRLLKGSVIMDPDGNTEEVTESEWRVGRPFFEQIIVLEAERAACAQTLKACEKQLSNAAPDRTFSAPLVIGGVAVVVSAAFVGGVFVGAKGRL